MKKQFIAINNLKGRKRKEEDEKLIWLLEKAIDWAKTGKIQWVKKRANTCITSVVGTQLKITRSATLGWIEITATKNKKEHYYLIFPARLDLFSSLFPAGRRKKRICLLAKQIYF